MVPNSRKTPSAGALRSLSHQSLSHQSLSYRPLNLPAPVEVTEDQQYRPLSITLLPTSHTPRKGRPLDSPPGKVSRPNSRVTSRATSRAVSRVITRVITIEDVWQVDDEWWREKPISRKYYRVTTEDDRHFTIFRDQTSGAWYQQQGDG